MTVWFPRLSSGSEVIKVAIVNNCKYIYIGNDVRNEIRELFKLEVLSGYFVHDNKGSKMSTSLTLWLSNLPNRL